MSRTYIVALVMGLSLMGGTTADAALIVDLRFADGSKSKVAAAGNHTINVWGQITGGVNVNQNDDGLVFLHGSVRSQQVGGGAILGNNASGITANNNAGLFSTSNSVGGAPGTQQNTSADGIFDWGTTSTAASGGIKYNSTLNSGLDPVFANSTGAVDGTNIRAIPSGIEYLIGSFSFTIDPTSINGSALPGSSTRLDWFKMSSSTIGQHSHRVDATPVTSAATYLASLPANGVEFTAVAIPEPSTVVLLALGGLGLVGLRRWRKA